MIIIEGLITVHLLTPWPLSTLERGDTLCIANDASLRNLMEAIHPPWYDLPLSRAERGGSKSRGEDQKITIYP